MCNFQAKHSSLVIPQELAITGKASVFRVLSALQPWGSVVDESFINLWLALDDGLPSPSWSTPLCFFSGDRERFTSWTLKIQDSDISIFGTGSKRVNLFRHPSPMPAFRFTIACSIARHTEPSWDNPSVSSTLHHPH